MKTGYLLFLTALSGAIFGTITARYLLVEVDDHAKISPKGKLLFFKILFVVSKYDMQMINNINPKFEL